MHAITSLVFATFVFEVLFVGFGRVRLACTFDGRTGAVKGR
jgi:hypothetical protein